MARTRLAAGLLLCIALACVQIAQAEEAEAVFTVSGDNFDSLIKVSTLACGKLAIAARG